MAVNIFDANFYRAANPDLASFNDAQALSHFQNFGLNEGRVFSPFANLNFYRSSNPDLAAAGLTTNRQAFEHLQNYGVAEGRRFSQFVDLNFYRANNSDLASFNNEQLFEHLRNNGVTDGRQFSFTFDVNYYRNINSDLASQGLNNRQLLEQFALYGLNEGRISSANFNVQVYLANNSDLVAAGLNNQGAYEHFLLSGQPEGRPGNADYAANTSATARNVNIGSTPSTLVDFVGDIDLDDYYRISIGSDGRLNVSLTGVRDYANVQLLNSSGSSITSETSSSTNDDFINYSGLAAGTYFVRVRRSGTGNNTNYTLRMSSDTPSNLLWNKNSSGDIGTLSSTRSRSSSVSNSNTSYLYRFSLNTTSSFTLSLTGLSSVSPNNADVRLIRDANNNGIVDSGEEIRSSNNAVGQAESISSSLSAGTYFVQVYQVSGTTDYTLSLNATPSS